ncbi:MAG: Holliday junction branch migration protein RuvA [Alphaproteobacteria bacterium]|nr:Holliday junction branch migration protein RuvA [Alphaproteobacteria bacterium]
MIARLKGLLDSIGEDWAVIDVGGVGYLIFCSARTLSRFPGAGEAVSVEIETHVREDHIHLYGFADAAEKEWFKILTGVQGVGAKVGLAILSVLPPDALATAIAAADKTAIARSNGVGPKLAGRIVSELKEKVASFDLGVSEAAVRAPGQKGGPAAVAAGSPGADIREDAVSALVNLGFDRTKAFSAVAGASRTLGAEAPLDDLVRVGLKELAP